MLSGRPSTAARSAGVLMEARHRLRQTSLPTDQTKSYREFNLSFADFGIVYRADLTPVNPPGRKETDLPIAIEPTPIPLPESISAADPGTQLVNYRNEPIPLRIGEKQGGDFVQKQGAAGDMANVFDSKFTAILSRRF